MHETVYTRSEHCNPRVLISIPVRGNFLLHLFCSNTILASVPESSILGKPQLIYVVVDIIGGSEGYLIGLKPIFA